MKRVAWRARQKKIPAVKWVPLFRLLMNLTSVTWAMTFDLDFNLKFSNFGIQILGDGIDCCIDQVNSFGLMINRWSQSDRSWMSAVGSSSESEVGLSLDQGLIKQTDQQNAIFSSSNLAAYPGVLSNSPAGFHLPSKQFCGLKDLRQKARIASSLVSCWFVAGC